MAGEVLQVTDEQVARVLRYEEYHFGDLKAKEITPAKMSVSVAAFANADGGELWIGIAENPDGVTRRWDGFARVEDANAHVAILDSLFPFGAAYNFEFIQNPDAAGFVLHVEVPKTRSIIRTSVS